MAEQEQHAPGCKRMSLDKIIESMTADLENSAGQYVQFGVTPPSQTTVQPPHGWGDYTPGQARHYLTNQPPLSAQPGRQPMNPIPSPIYMPEIPPYDPPSPDPMYFPPQPINHLGLNENNNLVGTIDVGGGNYINVIYRNPTQIMAEQRQLNTLTSYNSHNADREYGLFGDQRQMPISPNLTPQSSNGKQLIDNLVGNWVPNQSGTYSPFGGSPNVTPVPQSTPEIRETEELPRNLQDIHHKKPRMVAEVRPMRPSYSDVLTKSAPTPPPPLTPPATKPKIETTVKKNSIKSAKNKTKPAVLKRQNSSGSEDHNSPKIQVPKKVLEKNNSNLPRRWVSLDNLGSQTESHELNTFDRSENIEKKKSSKIFKKGDKNETLNNTKIQNGSSKCAPNTQKRPIQINNNLTTINISSQTVSLDKIEKNQQANNKSAKDDKKITKEKSIKRSQAEKTQQIKKGYRNRKRESRESPVKDLCRNLNKHVFRWSKIGLKIFYWLFHLISDVVSMSANLVAQLGKCAWFYMLIYLKYSWVYVAGTFSKVKFLNAMGKRLDSWIGWSRFAFWDKLKSKKKEEQEENTNWIPGGLEANIALPSTGEEAMKRLLACKGKDPYSILGVTPTCFDDDIKKYYKRQAFLVHPDKNNQPGAEEAFKILVHAFDIIGEPERRQAFDQTRQVEAAWGELSDLLSQLHRKMEQAANTIRCTNCGHRHKRIPTHRPCYAARFCAQCKIRHSAKEGDIWAESRIMGFLWNYYACMEGAVYDVTEWAACQAGNLKHLRANTHSVQYRIVLGQRPPPQTINGGKKRQQVDPNTSEADFEDFLNNLYNHSKSGSASATGDPKSDNRRRKTKRKK
ncbi:dnaJ homolog dnj-5 [Neodiprion lecontei]|uniref:DnaJ homolog dnj-5 n=1 Tax=Neodiprion lecontei TaxID=441921 RepID=A0A6J0BIQ0_NEOLC|nr:dnaJ homolog dnj-5 [Neodiprion lecontei]XP_015514372.1 dnaJ homolog dnj-5 [Neodiprion lecontei]XP_015514373.1 dnaJ homolog dnj-5 [Neodiprion lecontei]